MTPETLIDLFVLSPVGLAEVDSDGRVGVANLAANRLLALFTGGEAPEDLFAALSGVAPDLSSLVRKFAAPRGVVIENMELSGRGGHCLYLSLVRIATGRHIAVITDVSSLTIARDAISRLEQRLLAVAEAAREYAIYTVDREGIIDSWSIAAERVHLWSASEVIGKSMTVLMPSEQSAAERLAGALSVASNNGWCEEEGRLLMQDGTAFWATTVVSALRDRSGETIGYSVVSHDVSEHMRMEEQLRTDAASGADYLTGARARRAFFDVAQSEVSRARRYEQPLTVLLIEPDRFRELTEEHGEGLADEWLRAMARLARQESRTTDVVGRVGGEAFAVLLPSTELSGGLVLAERIRERMQRHAFSGDYQGVRATVSIGVAEVASGIATVEGLLSAAGTATSRARQAGCNLVVGYDA